jgi:Ca2+/Na+ antiporter
MEGIIARFGSNYIISTFIPSLGFILIAITIFEPIFPESITKKIPLTTNIFSESAAFILILTIILGFVLSSLVIFFFKITEGYYILVRFPFWRKHHQREAQKLKNQIKLLQDLLTKAQNRQLNGEKIQTLKDKIYYLQSVYDQKYPQKIEAILPTRFGNILRAAETHANNRYGIDAVPMYPRLVHVIPESHHQRVQQANNSVSFLINCMVLSCLLALICLFASTYQYTVWRYAETEYKKLQMPETDETSDDNSNGASLPAEDIELVAEPVYFLKVDLSDRMRTIYGQRVGLYLLASLVFLLGGSFFYYTSLTTVFQYGEMIRSSYDLFRFDLLKQFRVAPPEDLSEEYDKWRVLSELIAIGQSGSEIGINIFYDHPEQNANK